NQSDLSCCASRCLFGCRDAALDLFQSHECMIPKRKERAQGPLFLIPGSDGSELELHADVSVGVVVYTSNVGVDVDDAAGQNGAAAQVVVSADTDSARFDVAGAIHVNFVLTEEALHGQSVSLVSSRQTDGRVELSAGADEHVVVFDEDAFHREIDRKSVV